MDKLYVVTSGMPGPGAAALLREASPDGPDMGPTRGGKYIELDRALEVVEGACEFVELETEDGRGVGPSSGIDWEEHRGGARLGPFHALPTAKDAEAEREKLLKLAGAAFDAACTRLAAGADVHTPSAAIARVHSAHLRGLLLEEVDARLMLHLGLVGQGPV